MNRFKVVFTAFVAVLSLLLFPAITSAGDLKGEGTVTYQVTQLAEQKLGDGTALTQSHLKGIIVSADTTNPLHLMPQDCVGVSLVDTNGIPVEQSGSCAGADKDGDTWMMTYFNKGDSRTWEFVSGTGKFAKITGGGTTAVLVATADGRFTISWQGTWSM